MLRTAGFRRVALVHRALPETAGEETWVHTIETGDYWLGMGAAWAAFVAGALLLFSRSDENALFLVALLLLLVGGLLARVSSSLLQQRVAAQCQVFGVPALLADVIARNLVSELWRKAAQLE